MKTRLNKLKHNLQIFSFNLLTVFTYNAVNGYDLITLCNTEFRAYESALLSIQFSSDYILISFLFMNFYKQKSYGRN